MAISRPEILIVDDELSIRTTLCHIFTELGYSVRSASDGFSALELIHELTPNILLSDLNMPGMSGFELLSVVRRIHPTICVIATSGAFFGTGVLHGVAADAFYEKASSLSFLFEAISQSAQSNWTIRRSSDRSTPITDESYTKTSLQTASCFDGFPRCLSALPKVLVDENISCQSCPFLT